jgi:hypothetical protein
MNAHRTHIMYISRPTTAVMRAAFTCRFFPSDSVPHFAALLANGGTPSLQQFVMHAFLVMHFLVGGTYLILTVDAFDTRAQVCCLWVPIKSCALMLRPTLARVLIFLSSCQDKSCQGSYLACGALSDSVFAVLFLRGCMLHGRIHVGPARPQQI